MAEEAQADTTGTTKQRFNLLAFPTETTALFALLVTAAVMLAVQLSVFIYLLLIPGSTLPNRIDLEELIRGQAFTQTILSVLATLSIPTLLTGIILGLAAYIYRRHPERVRHRQNLEPLSEKDKLLQGAVDGMAASAGIPPPYPVVEMPHGYRGTSGQAFGFRGKYFIRLDGGLRIWQRIKSARFRAIVFHELAHITNGDVWHSYFAEALWKAMIFLSILPLVLGSFLKIMQQLIVSLLNNGVSSAIVSFLDIFPLIVGLSLQTIMVLGIIATIRARLLRTREVYADWQASVWGAQDALEDIFEESAEDETSSGLGLLRLHPSAAERLKTLEQPNRLFRLSWFLPFIVGFLLALVLGGMFWLIPRLYTLILEPIRVLRLNLPTGSLLWWAARALWYIGFLLLLIIIFIPMAWLVSGVLGPQLQKQIAANLVARKRGFAEYFKLVGPAIALALGIEVGFLVTPFSLYLPKSLAGFGIDILMIPLVIALAWVFLVYARFINIRLFATHTGIKHSTWKTRLGRWALNVWAFLFFIPGLIFGRFLIWNVSWTDSTYNWFGLLLIGFGIWLALALFFGLGTILLSWGAIEFWRAISPPRCPTCRRVTRREIPAIETCEHCGHLLGKWLYVLQEDQT